MLHLLTEEHRQKVVREYKKRVLGILLLGVFFVFVVSPVFILPTFFLSYGRYADVKSKAQTLDAELSSKEDPSSSESIKSITSSIEALRMFDDKKSIYSILEKLIKEKPVGIQIKNIIFTPTRLADNIETMTIDIAGRSETRKNLVSFDQNLKSNPVFSEVVVPLASFAKEKNIEFSMKLTVSSSTLVFEKERLEESTSKTSTTTQTDEQ